MIDFLASMVVLMFVVYGVDEDIHKMDHRVKRIEIKISPTPVVIDKKGYEEGN
jgi:hypothetical protein